METKDKKFLNVVEVAFDGNTLPSQGELVWLTVLDRANQKVIDDILAIFNEMDFSFNCIADGTIISVVDVISWRI